MKKIQYEEEEAREKRTEKEQKATESGEINQQAKKKKQLYVRTFFRTHISQKMLHNCYM